MFHLFYRVFVVPAQVGASVYCFAVTHEPCADVGRYLLLKQPHRVGVAKTVEGERE